MAARNALGCGERITIAWPLKDAINAITELLREEWQQAFTENCRNKGKTYGNMFPEVSKTLWFNKKPSNLNATEIKQMNRILSNHTFCKNTLYKMNVEENPYCDACNTIEDSNHIIFNCSKYGNTRNKYPDLRNFTSLEELSRTQGEHGFNAITQFLKDKCM